ncbi:50S ribosomal protein L18 [Sphingomonas quercus]|uniref:Large ribosomal subunit protein uL18 n=1 Tax=Sphingomonas quercus TaxID=2842451 RepID=A0ABS6BJC2_9SPHN|nr:50S ribosomal protein L18 [Sphingomonas quercus]MBU3078407.1 50S ribosomal protein L18 [Sphingomonas quercus]
MAKHLSLFDKRRRRVRTALRARAGGRPRLSVHRSGRHIYAQIIDDAAGRTVASASSLEKDARSVSGANLDAASGVGKRLAERAVAAGVSAVVFDRGGFLFHGRVKALADAAREGGLEF